MARGNRSEDQGEQDGGRVRHPWAFDLGREVFTRIDVGGRRAKGESEQSRRKKTEETEGDGFGEAVVRMRGPE